MSDAPAPTSDERDHGEGPGGEKAPTSGHCAGAIDRAPGRLLAASLLLVVVLAAGAYLFDRLARERSADRSPRTTVAEALAGDTAGYRRAIRARPFSFPADHGPHPGFRTEWWYLTGNLRDADGGDGRRIGYQLTIFRVALRPPTDSVSASRAEASTRSPGGSASWATDQLYLGHFAVSDARSETFRAYEQASRGGAGLAGARVRPFRVWVEDWSMRSRQTGTFPIRVRAAQSGSAVDLTLRPLREPVLQGEQGLSRKGPESASYYYSIPRLETEGVAVVGGDTVQVSGLSWMDREWSTSALGPDQVGWDWFALHLDDGSDLMYYRLRDRDGSASEYSEGTLVGPDGATDRLDREQVELAVLAGWTDPGGDRYPVRWRLRVPDRDLRLEVRAVFPNQLLDLGVRYWEGMVTVRGRRGGRPISGSGYVELTGYGGGGAPPF